MGYCCRHRLLSRLQTYYSKAGVKPRLSVFRSDFAVWYPKATPIKK